MACYKLLGGVMTETKDPIGDGEGSYSELLYKAGYRSQISSMTNDATGAEITVYSTEEKDKPQYYVDITGKVHQLAVVVADDFPSLLSSLKMLGPLISLMALDQQTEIQAESIFARDER